MRERESGKDALNLITCKIKLYCCCYYYCYHIIIIVIIAIIDIVIHIVIFLYILLSLILYFYNEKSRMTKSLATIISRVAAANP